MCAWAMALDGELKELKNCFQDAEAGRRRRYNIACF